jgi:YD repeat-containing protein
MNKIRRAQLGFAALVLAAGLIPAAAQAQQPATPPSDQPATQPATQPADAAAPASDQYAASDKTASKKLEGELLSVDDATKMLSIRTKDGSEVKVAYNEQTRITGATDQAAGLATAAGSKVKVEFTGEGEARTATKITVEAKEKK